MIINLLFLISILYTEWNIVYIKIDSNLENIKITKIVGMLWDEITSSKMLKTFFAGEFKNIFGGDYFF